MSRSEGKTAERGTDVSRVGDDRDVEELLPEYLRVVGPVVVILAGLAAGVVYGPAMTVLVFAGGVMLAAIATFWNSIRALFGDTRLTGEDAYAIGAPSAEEEQKRAVLRAIKDIQFEHGVGKISDDDYEYLLAKYRTEAKRLLRVLDDQAQPQRDHVERLVTEYLRDRGMLDDDVGKRQSQDEVEDEVEHEDEVETEHEVEHEDGDESEDILACPECGAANDLDAVFCKKCGGTIDAEEEDEEDED